MFLKSKVGMSLVEIIVVLGLFSLIFGVLLRIFLSQNVAWKTGYRELQLQQNARNAMDNVIHLLRQSADRWTIDSVNYDATITGGDQIDFYLPVFDADNNITSLKQARICISSQNSNQLVKRIGSPGPEQVIGVNINNIASQKPFFQFNANNTMVDVKIPVIKEDKSFSLTSKARFRNSPPTLTAIPVEGIPQEEQ